MILNKNEGMLVKISSTLEGGAFLVKHVGLVIRLVTSKLSQTDCNRPLSRRLDRCDRVIQNESSDPNGGNICSFSGATCTSRVRHNASYVPYAQIRFDV